MNKLLILFFLMNSAFSATCDQYKKLEDKNVSPSTDKTCKSFHYYYKLKDKKGDEEALKCAYLELEKGDHDVFGGASILMMIYANGRGAKRDIDLALKYACLFGGAEAEVAARIKHLESLRMMVNVFDVCDDITSGFMEGHCARLASLKDREDRDKRLQKIESTFGVDSQKAFGALKAAFLKFKETRLRNEIDLSGSARARFLIEDQENLEREFLSKIERFEKMSPSGLTDDNEKYLNSTFEFLMTKGPLGTIKPEGVRATQKEWFKFRDAWLEFARVRYPKLSRENFTRELADDRIKQLEEIRNAY